MLIRRFRYDLARGLGSIILYLRQSPTLTEKHIDAIYDACIKNTAYDPQCEISREDYLWEIIQLSGTSALLQERILLALGTQEGWDLLQVYRLAKIFALNGNPNALTAMKKGFRYHEEWNSFIGDEEIIDAGGEQGFLFVAEQIGRKIRSSDYEEFGFLLKHAYESLGEDKVIALLEGIRDANIQAFIRSSSVEQSHVPSQPVEVSYAELKSSIRSKPGPLYPYFSWGRKASEADLVKAADDLLDEEDPRRLEAYLQIFRTRAFPHDPQKMVELARSGNKRLRSAAIRALSKIKVKDERIRQLGIELIRQPDTEIEALELFIHLYREEDLPLLEHVVFKKRSKYSFHSIGSSITDIFTERPSPLCQNILVELYKKGCCSICRKKFVQIMLSSHVLPLTIRDEMQYDCNPAIRTLR